MSAALEHRLAELNREIREYPTPIARCDAQLAGLLEERSRIFSQLNHEGSCTPAAVWINDGGFHGA
ncbi:MAG TPA: hypothetical protein VG873_08725 [Burkholderiales bacterium]|nr:hypothetical protein [Burkholderiales bacterium]